MKDGEPRRRNLIGRLPRNDDSAVRDLEGRDPPSVYSALARNTIADLESFTAVVSARPGDLDQPADA